MKKIGCISLLLVLLGACAGSPLKTGVTAEENKFEMASVREGMKEEKVIGLMGYPYKQEKREALGKSYDVLYYITTPVYLAQSQLIDENFTPFVFRNGHLLGWGWDYYEHIFERKKVRHETKYSDDKDEWPSNKHVIIPPPPKKLGKEAIEVNIPADKGEKDISDKKALETVDTQPADLPSTKEIENRLDKLVPKVKESSKENEVTPSSAPLEEDQIEDGEKPPACDGNDNGAKEGYNIWD